MALELVGDGAKVELPDKRDRNEEAVGVVGQFFEAKVELEIPVFGLAVDRV